MTFEQLKKSVEDRLWLLVEAEANCYDGDYVEGELHGRLEETKVILKLINEVSTEIPPLFSVTVDEAEPGVDRHDPERC